jgi:hypothetical protein
VNEHVNPRTRRRLRSEDAAAQPFVRESRPTVDGVGDVVGGRPVRTLSSIVRQGTDGRDIASSEGGGAPGNHVDDSIGASIAEDGEVPNDSDYRGPRGDLQRGPLDQEATTEEAIAGRLARGRRSARQ